MRRCWSRGRPAVTAAAAVLSVAVLAGCDYLSADQVRAIFVESLERGAGVTKTVQTVTKGDLTYIKTTQSNGTVSYTVEEKLNGKFHGRKNVEYDSSGAKVRNSSTVFGEKLPDPEAFWQSQPAVTAAPEPGVDAMKQIDKATTKVTKKKKKATTTTAGGGGGEGGGGGGGGGGGAGGH